jgi:S-DNA-T family DNA segregation ATPase FtsK/SpoIIIE
MERDFQRIGLTNRAGEPPIVISITPCGNNQKKQITLLSGGIPIEVYRDNLSELESILNMHIVQLYEGKDCESIMFDVISGNVKIPEKIDWSDESLPAKESVLALGENLTGQIIIDLSVTPHLLVGGSTGSGKTVLVKALIYQALAKGMEVYLMDMKGGLDYPPSWKNQCCSFCSDNQDALSMLTGLVEELNRRKGLFGQLSCANINKYNQQMDKADQIRRIIIVLDEIAELTDTTGMDKPHKELAQRTVAHLSTIARMGRAYGIHLIVGTQRPDATILPGQVKNNCDIRICGRADNVLSTIILDNADAADRISKDKQGRFLMQDGVEFQGYWLDI